MSNYEERYHNLLLERFDNVDSTLKNLQGEVGILRDDVVRLKVIVPAIGAAVGSGVTAALTAAAKMLHIL